jgi:hypothetical protein
MSATSTNYHELFRHQDLTRIPGEPSFSSIKILAQELKANARSVYSNIGGANHGHLGLLLTAPEYHALLSPVPFVRPVYPDPLEIPNGTVRLLADEMERNHKEKLRVFREVLGVENALKQQLIKAVEPAYLDAIHDPVTYDLNRHVIDNVQFLMDTYGKVTPETLYDCYEEISNTVYNPAMPIDTIFNSIVELSELRNAANIPYSEQQKITIGYNILNCSGRFVQDIRDWKRLAPADKTWTNFKLHFCRAHEELRKTSNETLSSLQQAHIAQQVIEGIQNLMPPFESPPEEPSETLPPVNPPPPPATPVPPVPPAALAVTDKNAILPSLMQQMASMQTMMMNMQTGMLNNCSNQGGCRGRGRGKQGGRGRGRGDGAARICNPAHHTHYCWTHGMCRHDGTMCQTPGEGHQPLATITNMMGGSTCNVV